MYMAQHTFGIILQLFLQQVSISQRTTIEMTCAELFEKLFYTIAIFLFLNANTIEELTNTWNRTWSQQLVARGENESDAYNVSKKTMGWIDLIETALCNMQIRVCGWYLHNERSCGALPHRDPPHPAAPAVLQERELGRGGGSAAHAGVRGTHRRPALRDPDGTGEQRDW